MSIRWDRLPEDVRARARPRARRAPSERSTYRCGTCGEILDQGWAHAERHADSHGGGRIEIILEAAT